MQTCQCQDILFFKFLSHLLHLVVYILTQDTTGNIVPEQRGQFTIKIEDGNFFMVSGFKGNRTLGYLCFHSEKGTLYHCGTFEFSHLCNLIFISAAVCNLFFIIILFPDLIRDEDEMPKLKPSVLKTIYPSEEGVYSNPSPDSNSSGYQDLLSVAVKIERDTTTNVKVSSIFI